MHFDNVRNSKLSWVSKKIFLFHFLTGKRKVFLKNLIVQHPSVVHCDCFSASFYPVLLFFNRFCYEKGVMFYVAVLNV